MMMPYILWCKFCNEDASLMMIACWHSKDDGNRWSTVVWTSEACRCLPFDYDWHLDDKLYYRSLTGRMIHLQLWRPWWLIADTLRMMVIDEVQLYEQVKHAGAYLLVMIDTLMTSCIAEVWPEEWYTYSYAGLDYWWLDKKCWWADHAESHDEQWRGRAAVLMRVLSRWSAVLTSSRTDWRNKWCRCDSEL